MEQQRKKPWVHEINTKRPIYGEYHHLMKDLCDDERKFYDYFRMKKDTFNYILKLLGPELEKMTTNFRKPISAEERLVITLR